MTDEEKHAWCKQRNGMGAVILPPALYEVAEEMGIDTRWYVMAKPVPMKEPSN